MLAGMIDMATRTGSPIALQVAVGMAGWVKTFVEGVLAQPNGPALWQTALNTEWGGMNDGLQVLVPYRGVSDKGRAQKTMAPLIRRHQPASS